MPDHFEALERRRFIGVNAGLVHGDRHLVLDGIHTFQIRQQKSSSCAACDNHAIALHIELFHTLDGFRFPKHVDTDFQHSMNQPSLAMARNITEELRERFDRGLFDRIYVCYTEFTGGMTAGTATHDRLLPFDIDDFVPEFDEKDHDASTVFEFEPDVETVLERSIRSYLVGYIYSTLVNSYSSEQNARMMAMDAANENASELLASLELEYNHLRQNAITQEITEISSGARSLKRKKGQKR